MGILKKVQFYRRALQVLFALNIGVLTAGAIAGVSYFSSIQFLKVLTQQNVDRLELLRAIHGDLTTLSIPSADKKISIQKIRNIESLRIRLETWPGSNLAQISLPESYDGSDLSPELLTTIRERVTSEEKELRGQIVDGTNRLGSLAKQLAILGFCTFVFGMLLPILLFRKLTKEMLNAKQLVEEKVSQSVAQWFKTHSQHGGNAFQDPSFWINILLITVEAFAPASRFPLMQFLGDFAPTLRKEIEKQKKAASTETDTRKAS